MPVLHWRDQAKLDAKNKRNKSNSLKQKTIEHYNRIEDSRAETERKGTLEDNLLPGSPKKQQRLTKQILERANNPSSAKNGGYDTVDTVTGPSADEWEGASTGSVEDKDNVGVGGPLADINEQEIKQRKKTKHPKKKGNQSETDEDTTTDEDNAEEEDAHHDGPEIDHDDVQSGYGSSLDYDIDYRHELDNEAKSGVQHPVDHIKLWRDHRHEQLADKAMRQCSNCDTQLAAWRCHGCDYNYCEGCNRDTHKLYCQKYRPTDHVLQRIDGKPLNCGRCRKGVWEIAKHGYDHFNHQYQKKRRAMKISRMREEMEKIQEQISEKRSMYKKERKGHRLRQAQVDQLADMKKQGKEEADRRIAHECDVFFAPMLTPLHFDPSQLELERGENGQPLLPPPVDKESGRSVAMFSFDFNRNSIMCRACNVFWNSGPLLGRRVVVNAYAPVGPVVDPQAAARRSVQRIHDTKIHERLLEKLRLEALAKSKIKPPKKSRACIVM